MPNQSPLRTITSLAIFMSGTLLVGGIGGFATSASVQTWYTELERPFYAPPNFVFGPVWTLIYIMIAIAGWRVWRSNTSAERTTALSFWFFQLALNLAWSFIFFYFHQIGMALVEIIVLLAAITVTAQRFQKVDKFASWLLYPYMVWVSFAASLNFGFWWLNY